MQCYSHFSSPSNSFIRHACVPSYQTVAPTKCRLFDVKGFAEQHRLKAPVAIISFIAQNPDKVLELRYIQPDLQIVLMSSYGMLNQLDRIREFGAQSWPNHGPDKVTKLCCRPYSDDAKHCTCGIWPMHLTLA